MKKRGQIGVYLLVGLIFVFIIGYIVSINYEKNKLLSQIDFDVIPIKDNINNCVKETFVNAAVKVGVTGGYDKGMLYYTYDDYLPVSYHLYDGKDHSYSIEEFEIKIQNYINDNLVHCVNDTFLKFPMYKYNYINKTSSQVNLHSKGSLVKVYFPIQIISGDLIKTIDVFEYTNSNNAEHLYNVFLATKKSVEILKENNDMICMSCLSEIGKEYDLEINVLNLLDKNYLISVIDYNTTLFEDEYFYDYIAYYPKYEDTNFSYDLDEINYSAQVVAFVGRPFFYNVPVRAVSYELDSDLFQISRTGQINFIPNISHIGNHSLYIMLNQNQNQYQFFNLDIEVR